MSRELGGMSRELGGMSRELGVGSWKSEVRQSHIQILLKRNCDNFMPK